MDVYQRSILKQIIMANFSKRSIGNLIGVHPDLVEVLLDAIKDTPVDFMITSGVRSLRDQKALYAQGRTRPGKVVTNADGVRNKSNHQAKEDGFGYAVDLYPFYNGSVQIHDDKVVPKLYEIADHIISVAESMGVKIEWGGDWKMRDYPHFELK